MAESRPPFSPTIALLTVARAAEVAVASALEPHGLTLRKYGILGHIAHTPGLSLSELARRSGITVQSVHTLINALVDAGFVKSVVPSSGHAAQLSVTPAGADLLGRLNQELAALDAELFDSDGMRQVADALAVVTSERLGPPQD
jgi:DNA-binding MarR family transcriptional regulator